MVVSASVPAVSDTGLVTADVLGTQLVRFARVVHAT